MKTIQVILKKDKEKPMLAHHPWIFSGAIDRIEEGYQAGDLAKVCSSEEKFLGTGMLNPASQIAVRMLSFSGDTIDDTFFEARIRAALALRKSWISGPTNAYRVIHSENDFLPGVTADRYGDYLIVQFQAAGIEPWRDAIVRILAREIPVRGIYEKGDTEWRRLEGLEARQGVLWGEEPPDEIAILEHGISFQVDAKRGQKTGFFLDQRENRKLVGEHSGGRRMLNCFSYTGGFSVYAAKGGAPGTVSVDSSEAALATAARNFEANGIGLAANRLLHTDVFQYLRQGQEPFDLIVLDPPAFCQSKTQIDKAARAYKDINLFALKRLAAGGLLFTASCSSFISQDLFQKILFGAARDAGRDLRILVKTGHAWDHPVNIYFPEGEYLKGFFCQAD